MMFIKLWYGDDCRRLKVENVQDFTIDNLTLKISELYTLTEPVLLKYKDFEDDLVTISANSDLDDFAISGKGTQEAPLKLYVFPKFPLMPDFSVLQDFQPSHMTRARFDSVYEEREMFEILRDISIYICSRDLTPPGVRSWVSSQKSLVTPDTALGIDSRPLYSRVTKVNPLSKQVLGVPTIKVAQWTPDQVGCWLSRLGFSELIPVFKAHDINGEALLDLDHESLKELGIIATGTRIRLLKRISQVNSVLLHSSSATSPMSLSSSADTTSTQ
ncbi:hypothetical protein DSO57_1006073 [Entomophthora muscae]|uniref:Uncharacterized protein n=1 Tax=Entomophthora muscae TaxID=34485 RepID=A0ACC2SWS0_9FUNG|nr:hypothetical protein DSO57_1006073 [Entomophthora muscae]